MRRVIALAALLIVGACAVAPEGRATPPERRIALTFDDAPTGDGPLMTGPERGAALICALEAAESGPVGFFVTTSGFDRQADGRARIRAYAEAGHLIANHSDGHPRLSRTALPDYLADLDLAEAKLEGLPNRRPWFRFPFLNEGGSDRAKRDAMRAALSERALINGYVTVDTYDWHVVTALRRALREGRAVDHDALRDVYVAMIVEAAARYDALSAEVLGRAPAHVLLLHENDLAALFVGDAIRALRAEGWTIIGPDEAFADPLADADPLTLFSGRGKVAAIAVDRELREPPALAHWSAEEAGIDRRLDEAGVFGPSARNDAPVQTPDTDRAKQPARSAPPSPR